MFSKRQLELISSLLQGEEISQNDRHQLRKHVESAIWQLTNGMSASDRRAYEMAIAAGKLTKVPKGVSGIPEPVDPRVARKSWMDTPKEPKAKPSRMKPQEALAKTGDELLAVLGI